MALLEKNIMRPKSAGRDRREDKEFDERILQISRVSRVAKGGRRIRFRALIVIGDKKGRVGMGIGKSAEVQGAVAKATSQAKKNLITVPIINGTIPHEVLSKSGAAIVLLKPASEGTSMVAGGAVRSVVELAGISDILAKIMGSRSMVNNVRATLKALNSFNPDIVEKLKLINEKSVRKELESKGIKVEEVVVKEAQPKAKETKKVIAKKIKSGKK